MVVEIPKSAHIGMKWVWTRPLVLAPQTKKVPNRIQNTRVFDASRKAVKAAETIDVAGGAAGTGAVPSSPTGRRPRSDGRLLMNSNTIAAAMASITHMVPMAARHPNASVR